MNDIEMEEIGMTYRELYKRFVPEEKSKEERYSIMEYYIFRPLSILATMPFLNTSISPTSVTKASVACSLIGFGFLAFGKTMVLRLIGWLWIFAWVILDGVDGNIARYKKQCSPLGDLWDTMGGYAAMVEIYFGAGIAAFYDMNLIVIFENYWYLIIGSAAAIFSIFPRLVMHKKKSSVGNSSAVQFVSDKKTFGILNIIAMNIASPSSGLPVLLLISIVAHMLNIFICAYFIVTLGIMIISLKKLLRD